MSEVRKSDGLTISILIALGIVVLAALGVGGMALRRYQSGRERERRAQVASNLAAIRQALDRIVVITVQVESWAPASRDVPVHAARTAISGHLWIVQCSVLENSDGKYPFDDCNVLIHSPSADLGVVQKGQKLRFTLQIAQSPPQVLVGPASEPPSVVLADPERTYELLSYENLK